MQLYSVFWHTVHVSVSCFFLLYESNYGKCIILCTCLIFVSQVYTVAQEPRVRGCQRTPIANIAPGSLLCYARWLGAPLPTPLLSRLVFYISYVFYILDLQTYFRSCYILAVSSYFTSQIYRRMLDLQTYFRTIARLVFYISYVFFILDLAIDVCYILDLDLYRSTQIYLKVT